MLVSDPVGPSVTLARLLTPRQLKTSACCPICGSLELLRLGSTVVDADHMGCSIGLVSAGQTLHYDLCGVCEFVFLNPRYAEAMLAEYYTDVCPLNEAATQPADRSTNDRYRRRERERFSRLFRLALRYARSLKSVVDVGALDGASLIPFAQAGCSVHAVEPGWDARTPALPGVVAFDSLERFASDGPLVDCLLSTQTFEHLRNPTRFAAECGNVVKPGGVLVIELPYDLLQMTTLLTAGEVKFGHPEHINFFSRRSLWHAAHDAGLEALAVMPGVQIHKYGGLIPSLTLVAQVPLNHTVREGTPVSSLERLLIELDRDARHVRRLQRFYQMVGFAKRLGRW